MTTLNPSTVKPNRNEWWEATKTITGGLAIAATFHLLVAEVRYIPSESMTPTLQVGDRLIVGKLSYRIQSPKSEDVVVFKATTELKVRNLNDDMIKRIIGTPGDTVAVQRGQVYLNGKALTEPYIQTPAAYNYGPVTVPANYYFVLGDNRNHSYDSHTWGFVSRQDIVGRAAFQFYPLFRMKLVWNS
jgi:signal peptidase I